LLSIAIEDLNLSVIFLFWLSVPHHSRLKPVGHGT
jgi:hypothetical protein